MHVASPAGSCSSCLRLRVCGEFLHLQEVGYEFLALGGEDALGVELDTFGGVVAVAQAHDDTRAICFDAVGTDLELGRKG